MSVFTGAYKFFGGAKLLESRWLRPIFVSAYFSYKRLYEDALFGLVNRNPKLFRDGDILDVGANIGYTACLFSRVVSSGFKVYAFEPDRVSFEFLTEVLQRRDTERRVQAMQVAMGASEGTLPFWHNAEHSADHRVATEHFRSLQKSPLEIAMMRVTSVDNFVKTQGLRKVSFVKIDVQGYELAVCDGMQETLVNFPEMRVCVEYSPKSAAELGFSSGGLIDFFRSRGYRLYSLTRAGIQPAETDHAIAPFVKRAGYVDLLCSKKALRQGIGVLSD